MEDILKVVEAATLHAEGHNAYYDSWFTTPMWMMDRIDDYKVELQKTKKRDKTYNYLSTCCDHSWHKAEKYFSLCDKSPIVYAAIVLNPTLQMEWFKDY